MKVGQPTTPRPLYTCSACGLGVIVLGEQKFRACKCEAPIVANAGCSLAGRGGVRT